MDRGMVSSWGNLIRAEHELRRLTSRHADFPELPARRSVLPFGNGRSYGDSCLNVGGALLEMRALDRFIAFDRNAGVITCEAGLLLDELLEVTVPAGWFVPVTPGTRFVTVGGAIANDVHGKNHHVAGTFGRHVRRFELLRSTGARLTCSPTENPEWFAVTIGGLGLTGVITWAEIQLRPIATPWLEVETIRFGGLAEFFELCAQSDRDWEHTVAWIDCTRSPGSGLGRGLLQRANHLEREPPGQAAAAPRASAPHLKVPFVPPVSLVNGPTLRAFNSFYYHRQRASREKTLQHYQRFFYPLDGILNWNRLYGARGFYQYQCVVPLAAGREAVAALLEHVAASGQGSFLAVLKLFGAVLSPGMLSFPMEGVTLALDFPNRGAKLARLLAHLDELVAEAGGRLYPAKDARMPGSLFRSGYPRWREFVPFIDPRHSSSFWRRVMAAA
jgi:FAD/FMN-containing dehydrogenase